MKGNVTPDLIADSPRDRAYLTVFVWRFLATNLNPLGQAAPTGACLVGIRFYK